MHETENVPRITIEHALWVGVLLLAALLRLYDLGAQPLSSAESTYALSAWQLVQGQAPQVWDAPLVESATAIVFFLLGGSDFAARLMPVLMGVTLVGLLWPLRSILGKGAALTAACLLAFSPTMIHASRTILPGTFVAALSLLAVLCWLRYREGGRSVLLYGGAAALALLLNSGAMGLSALLLLAGTFALLYALGMVRDLSVFRERLGAMTVAGVVFLGVYVVVASGLFTYGPGLGMPFLGLWMAEMKVSPIDEPWYQLWGVLAAYEPLALLFGILGAGHYWRAVFRESRLDTSAKFGLLLAFWVMASLLLMAILGRKAPGQSLLATVPLTILAGGFLANRLACRDWGQVRRAGPHIAVAIVAVVFSVLLAAALNPAQGGDPRILWPLLGGGVLLVGAATVTMGQRHGSLPVVVLGSVLAMTFTLHTAWRLNFTAPTPEVFAPEVVHAQGIQEVLHLAMPFPIGYPAAMIVEESLREPLAWYLRERQNVTFSPGVTPGAPLILARADVETQRRLAGYVVEKHVLSSIWSPQGLGPLEWWRWLIYREARSGWEHHGFAIYRQQ